MRHAFLLFLCAILLSSAPTTDPDVLATARRLAAGTYKGYTYGSTGERHVDCVQFVSAVVDDLAKQCGATLPEAARRTLMVKLSEKDDQNLQALVAAGDPKIQGVQAALVSAGFGTKVATADAQAGDLVQYWYREGDQWRGHSGIVEKVDKGQATIYGSHKTTLQTERELPLADRKGGIGSGPTFALTDAARKVYVVRWTLKPH